MFHNKSLHLDPLASRLVCSVTEYSATQGSSGFSEEHWPGMDTERLLIALRQGSWLLENHIHKFIAIANYSDLPDKLFVMALISLCDLSLDMSVHVLSWIWFVALRLTATKGHFSIILTLTPHITLDCISHHPVALITQLLSITGCTDHIAVINHTLTWEPLHTLHNTH